MKTILGLDIGFGATKVVLMQEDGTPIKLFKFPSIIGITSANEHISDNRIYRYKEHFYYVGEMALNLPSNNLIDITDYKNLEFYAPLLVYHALRMLDTQTLPDMVVSGLSKAQIQNSGYFKEAISNFEVDGKEFKFENLYVLPQGAGSKLAIDKYGDDFPNPQTEFNGSNTFIGVDIGFNTIDMFMVANGKTSPSLFEGIEHEGIMRMAADLVTLIKNNYGKELSLHEAQEIITSGIYKLRNNKFDLKNEIKTIKESYLKHLLDLINERYNKALDKADYLYLSGGGSAFFNNSENGFIKVPKSHHEYYNSIGFTLWGIQKLNQNQ